MSDPEIFVVTTHEWIEVFMRRSMQDLIHYSRQKGLSMSQMGALFHIHKQGSSAVSDLGEHLGVTNAAASQMLDRLVQQGLISRSEDPTDRRVKQIILTDQGREVLQAGIRARKRWLTELDQNLSDLEKDQIVKALRIMIAASEKSQQHAEPDSER
jgi:DNA-binding MarR family transcriptional regulator